MRAVRDIMESNVVWLPMDMPLRRAAELIAEKHIGGAPVCEPDGKIVGMCSKTDLVANYGCAHEARIVRDVMTPAVVTIAPNDPIERAVQLMAFAEVHRLLVLEEGRLAGIVTSMDVLRDLAGFPRRGLPVAAIAPPA